MRQSPSSAQVDTGSAADSPETNVGGSNNRAGILIAERPELVLLGVLALLVLITGVIEPGFISVNGLRNTLLQAAPLGILAGAQTILMLTGGIDLSVTMIATGSAYVAANQSENGDGIAILLGMVVGLISGMINGVGVALFRVNPLIMTLAMSGILLGLFTAWTQTILQGSTQVGTLIKVLSAGSFFGNRIPYSVVVWALIAVVLIWLLRRSGWGRLLYAVGDNEVAVRLAGVRVWQVRITAYIVAGVLASIAGLLLAGRTGAVDLQLANTFLLPSVAAAVIGGTSIFGGVGGYVGTIIGALILSVLNSMLTFLNVGQDIQQVVYGAIVLALAWGYASLTQRA
ncbi:ABC transporter permease [Chloroflexi bacterium TSY]|nr:ABC transporter permease [Chloroflexi bacterium TSY]